MSFKLSDIGKVKHTKIYNASVNKKKVFEKKPITIINILLDE